MSTSPVEHHALASASPTETFWRLLRAYGLAEEQKREQEAQSHRAQLAELDEKIAECSKLIAEKKGALLDDDTWHAMKDADQEAWAKTLAKSSRNIVKRYDWVLDWNRS